MSRIRPFAVVASVIAGVLASTASVASAAPGDVSSTPFTPPAAVSGANLNIAFSDGGTGSYQVFASGQTRSLLKVLANGTTDTAFNGGTPVALGVPTALQSSGTIRVAGTTHAGTKNWWISTSNFQSNGNLTGGIVVTSGDTKGAVTVNKSIDGATLKTQCEAGGTTVMGMQNLILFPRRNGGAWLSMQCVPSTSNAQFTVLLPLTQSGDVDSSATPVRTSAAHGASATCFMLPAVVADPTSKAPAPELWIVRTEHNFQTSGACATSTTNNASSGIASNYVALSSLAVTANGTVTRTQLMTTPTLQPAAMRVDAGGRVVALATDLNDSTKVKMFRIKTDGSLDTTVGTNGLRDLDTGALPTGATSVRPFMAGVVTTSQKTYFAIMLYDQEVQGYTNNSTTPRTHGFRMGLATPADGWATGYGTNGIGARVSTTVPENWFNDGKIVFTGTTVSADGKPSVLINSQTATALNVWAPIAGVTGGGDGGTGLGGATNDTGGAPSAGQSAGQSGTAAGGASTAGRVDRKVYTRLPRNVQVNTALAVLSTSAARGNTLVSKTNSTCVVASRHVIAIAAGRCVVDVTRRSNGAVARSLSTTVTTKSSTVGTQVTVATPIKFAIASSRLSRTARTQIAAAAKSAEGAQAIAVVGHAAALTESPFNFAISKKRADTVRSALRQAKVTAPVTVTARGTLQQISTTKTESAQAQNRRVAIYIVP